MKNRGTNANKEYCCDYHFQKLEAWDKLTIPAKVNNI
jgi:hypothetical protein